MYYGNADVTSQQNKTVVWDENTKMVQHLQESPANGVAGHLDSTQYANNGTPQGFDGTATSTTNGTGQIDGADVFDGSDYVDCGNDESLDITDKITISAWVELDDIDSDAIILSKGDIDGEGGYILRRFSSGKFYAYTYIDGDWYNNLLYGDISQADKWYNVVLTFDGDISKLYVNNILVDEKTYSGTIEKTTSDLKLGTNGDNSRYFPGTIDEVRVSNTARSADWIATEYNNQSNPTEFYSLGIEEVPSPVALSSFTYRKAITIDHTKVSADLTDFPVLVNLPTDASLASHAQADGDDILFTSNDISWSTGT
ncbi:MAG: LamG domain-containing protein, partial [Candidatus Paceibacterota bacterium]